MLATHVLPCAVPDVDSHGYRRHTIDDHVPGVCNGVTAFTTPGCGYADSRMFEDKIERMLYTLANKLSRAGVFIGDVRKGIDIRLQCPRRPFKPLGGVYGHGQHRSRHEIGAALLHASHTRAASHRALQRRFH